MKPLMRLGDTTNHRGHRGHRVERRDSHRANDKVSALLTMTSLIY